MNAPFSAPLGPVIADDADDNIAFGTEEYSQPHWSVETTRMNDTFTLTFDNSTLGTQPNSRIIMVDDTMHQVKWSLKVDPQQKVGIVKVTWLGQIGSENQTIDQAAANSEESTPQPVEASRATTHAMLRGRISAEPMTLGQDSVFLPVGELRQGKNLSRYESRDMYLTVEWESSNGARSTTSGVFTVLDGFDKYNDTVKRLRGMMATDSKNFGEEGPSSSESGSDTASGPTASVVATTTLTPTSPSLETSGNSNSGSVRSGLPAGAIAGIVIGSVLGLALIAFLVWFFLRRRRRAGHVSNGVYGSDHGPQEYLADKENRAHATESPHSPYSDDGQNAQHVPEQQHHIQRGSGQEAGVPASVVSATERRILSPYSVEEQTPIVARSVEDMTRNGARSSTPNVNANVSHLIEDGMTEDEIRRLEEEELALDVAIERAGQGQRQGQEQGQR
ncbi:hypothetical protein CH63R_11703 [Colletotrichum higginsianum IMI 349063]|uniref:Uncharacterized protein n=1 Tax=Colletotrichum higginsianum (strain IMI 349063) TaxID=759273 RepID=A0A1B7XZ22_COLHI|nr:hypothetical protein CH63R_11703 [Colletotrichum higginsianum IMI 349063]OBR05000.1 hypothetical protein CH63R_11703 [Colletotrichum higginsianum IMI 349063]